MDANYLLARRCLDALAALGVREVCLCPGRRNAPFVSLLDAARGVQVYHFFEERSAAFFALGRIKKTGAPVAVCTTSGTAVAELLPATIEAWYSGLPLILVSSDRPRRLRGSGAPQTIEQVGLFGPYVTACVDIERESEIPQCFEKLAAPLHLNVCFDEPLREHGIEPFNWAASGKLSDKKDYRFEWSQLGQFLSGVELPLVMVGGLSPAEARPVERFLSRLGAPVLAEASSQLTGSRVLAPLMLTAGNRFVQRRAAQGVFGGVLRIGGVPSQRIWRDLDETLRSIPVCSVSAQPFRGLERGELIAAGLEAFFDRGPSNVSLENSDRLKALQEENRAARAQIDEVIERYPESEVGMLRSLERLAARDAAIYLGNSLPIREWDLLGQDSSHERIFASNRGANGIDGQASTFFGWSAGEEREHWAVLGDLTTLYDLSSPWALKFLAGQKIRIAIVNNSGGQIFSRMFKSQRFQNQHSIGFEHWAAQWGIEYACWAAGEDFPSGALSSSALVIELRPSATQTDGFWQAFDKLSH